MLKDMDRSWRLFEAKHVERNMPPVYSPAMELGTAIHTASLEPERFSTEYVTEPKLDRRTKAYKEWKSEVHPSMKTIKHDDMEVIVACRDSLIRHTIIGTALRKGGSVELSHYWTCSLTDVPCRFRPDLFLEKAGLLVDIKTTSNVDTFEKAIVDFGYHIQAAHYCKGVHEVYGIDDVDFLFAVVETNPPYRSRAVMLDAEAIGYGYDRREALLDNYARRLNLDDWRDPGESEPVVVSLPQWYLRKAV